MWSMLEAAWEVLQARITRPSLYKVLSKKGNPTLGTLQQILKPLGLRVAIALDEVA